MTPEDGEWEYGWSITASHAMPLPLPTTSTSERCWWRIFSFHFTQEYQITFQFYAYNLYRIVNMWNMYQSEMCVLCMHCPLHQITSHLLFKLRDIELKLYLMALEIR